MLCDLDLLALLALRASVGPRGHDLAHALCLCPRPWAVLQTGRWCPAAAAWQLATRQLHALRALGLRVVPAFALPPWARRLRPLPVALFVRGQLGLLRRRGVAIVGSRRATMAACSWSLARAASLAESGCLVISGGALGIDGAAHRGALQRGGLTLVYLGGSIDDARPVQHRSLFQAILLAGGALVSEHPPLTESRPYHYALRNRLIAAQARLLWVAEAGVRSGTLNTAGWAHSLEVPIQVAPALGQERGGLRLLTERGWATPWRALSSSSRLDRQPAAAAATSGPGSVRTSGPKPGPCFTSLQAGTGGGARHSS